MLKKIIHVFILVALTCYVVYKIVENMVSGTIDDANKKAVEIYADAIKLETISIDNVMESKEVDLKNIKVTTKVECEEVKILEIGQVELHGCRVEKSKRKYKYVNGGATRE